MTDTRVTDAAQLPVKPARGAMTSSDAHAALPDTGS